MFSAILALLSMPFTDLSKLRGIQFRPLSKIAFFVFVSNFLILMQLGAKHVESPFIELGQISTALYFSHFLIIVPFVTLLENSLIDLATNKAEQEYNLYDRYINSIITFIKRISSLFCFIAIVGLVFKYGSFSMEGFLYGAII
jgi:ubiquinol-cytochrome c reductase cytochrome b subunit